MATHICSFCGHPNIPGDDRCEECFHTLMTRDLPQKHKDGIKHLMLNAPVGELLTGKDLLVASTTDAIAKLVQILQKEKKKCFLVYKRKKLVGIISTRDILLKIAGKNKDLNKVTAAEIMTSNPEYVRAEDPMALAVNKMAMGGFRNLPVLRADGTPLSIISIKDVLSFLSNQRQVPSG